MRLNEYLNTMREKWWLCLEEGKDRAGGITTDQLITGFEMLDAIRGANDWSDPVIEAAPYITAKDVLMTLCDVLNVEWETSDNWDEVYNALEAFINDIEE